MHADTQGQSQPVFALAHLLGFDLMPRVRNWKGLTFHRPRRQAEYVHIDALFGEYSTHELGIQPDAYDPQLDVDFTRLREENVTSEGFGQAA